MASFIRGEVTGRDSWVDRGGAPCAERLAAV
jgi:hypothetical protein